MFIFLMVDKCGIPELESEAFFADYAEENQVEGRNWVSTSDDREFLRRDLGRLPIKLTQVCATYHRESGARLQALNQELVKMVDVVATSHPLGQGHFRDSATVSIRYQEIHRRLLSRVVLIAWPDSVSSRKIKKITASE